MAYLNVDFGIYGNFSYEAKGSPLLFDLIFNVTKSIKQTSNETVFERWLQNDPDTNKQFPK